MARVILMTGHPCSGKTTVLKHIAPELGLPTICKDAIKEVLYDTVGWSDSAWSMKLNRATWALVYQQVEELLKAGVSLIAEGNVPPEDNEWGRLHDTYGFTLTQVRCEMEPETLLARYRKRLASGERHPGHANLINDVDFLASVRHGPLDWVDVPGERISVDTTDFDAIDYAGLVARLASQDVS